MAAGGGAPQDRFVFSERARGAVTAYVVVTSAVAGVFSTGAEGRVDYLTVWAVVALPYWVPALVAARIGLGQVAVRDRLAWQLWFLGWCVIYAGTLLVYLVGVHDWGLLRWAPTAATLVGSAAFGVANAVALRRRSGQRALWVDLVDLATTVVAVVGPVLLLVGDLVVGSPHLWLTLPATLVVISIVHGFTTFLLIHARVSAERRSIVRLGVLFCALGLLDSGGRIAQGVADFDLPALPLVTVHALCMGGGLFVPFFALRRTSGGLDRLPPQEQVRKNGILAAVVLAAMVVMAGEALGRRDHGWVVVTSMALIMALLVLSTVRHLVLSDETVRLYGEVERVARERRELLSDVLRSVDGDRHGAAQQLHAQAASLYVAMGSFARAMAFLSPDRAPASVSLAAERVQSDLAQHVDASQEIMRVFEPAGADDPEGAVARLVTLTRAYVGHLWGDLRPPRLRVVLGDGIVLDWMHEVVAFRIVQVALDNVHRHAEATTIDVAVTAPEGALTVEVADDGDGFDPTSVAAGAGMPSMESLVAFVGGDLEVDSAPGCGTRLRAILSAPLDRPRPKLRVVTDSA